MGEARQACIGEEDHMTIGTALFFLIVYFASGQTKVSVTLEQDMNACHDTNMTAAKTIRLLNEREPVRQFTGIFVNFLTSSPSLP